MPLFGFALSFLAAALVRPGALAERTVADVYAPGDEATWIIEHAGKRIGHCWSRYEGVVELAGARVHAFRAQAELALQTHGGALEQRFTTDLWTDERGNALRAEFRASAADVYASVEVDFADDRVFAKVFQNDKETTKEIPCPSGARALANNFVSHLELALALDPPAAGEKKSYAMFSLNALAPFPLAVEPHAGAGAEPGLRWRDSLGEELVLSPAGLLESLALPAQQIQIRRAPEEVARFTLAPPAPVERADLDREEVVIEHGPVSLAGTVTRPKGSSGLLPAIFFVSGSGAQDRDGMAAGMDLGTREILDRLTQAGFLVLRVDDRGAGASTGPTADMTFDDLVEDARASVRYLLGRDDVERARVALIGHSEGGQTVPILAAEMPEIAALVLMAAPGRPILELMHEQLRRAEEREGADAAGLAAFDAAFEAFEAHVRGEREVPADLPASLRMFLPAIAWARSHVRQDPLANVVRVKAPILILQGERDIQVSAERDAKPLAAALDGSAHADHELVVFPELDHLFKRTVGAESSPLDYLKSRPVDAGFLDVLVAWLTERLVSAPR